MLQTLEHNLPALQVHQRAVGETRRLARAKLVPRRVRHALIEALLREFRHHLVEDGFALLLLRDCQHLYLG